jgi:hypothetical protein
VRSRGKAGDNLKRLPIANRVEGDYDPYELGNYYNEVNFMKFNQRTEEEKRKLIISMYFLRKRFTSVKPFTSRI